LIHPMGTKFARSLIRASKSAEFDLTYFKLYMVQCGTKALGMSEVDMIQYFDLYYENFIDINISLKDNILRVLKQKENLEEPWLFIACAAEYYKYKKFVHENPSKTYYSNFLIYLDATAS